LDGGNTAQSVEEEEEEEEYPELGFPQPGCPRA